MRGSKLIVFAIAVGLMLPATASAKVLSFKGIGQGDPATKVTFKVKGKFRWVKLKNGKRRKRFVPRVVSEVRVENQTFTCYNAAEEPAYSGRNTYPGFTKIPPMKVNKKGRFKGVHVFPQLDLNPIEVYRFQGRIVGRKGKGTFRGQYSPGGIDYGYCGDKTPQPWTAKG